jgi:hypothetical protein
LKIIKESLERYSSSIIMVRRIEGSIHYEKHNEVLNDNHKVLIYLDDMTLTGKKNVTFSDIFSYFYT